MSLYICKGYVEQPSVSLSQPYRYAIANNREGGASMNRSEFIHKYIYKPSISSLKVASMTFCSSYKEEKWGILEDHRDRDPDAQQILKGLMIKEDCIIRKMVM